MATRDVAAGHYRALRALADAAARVALEAWGRVEPDSIVRSWASLSPEVMVATAGAQQAAASRADSYLDAVLAVQGLSTEASGGVAASALSGTASDGRPLDTLLAQPANLSTYALASGQSVPRALAQGRASLDMIVRTQVVDAGRVAEQVAIVARPAVGGYVRLLVPPSCPRCAILAGRWYRYSAGFSRHPNCNCIHIPSNEDAAGDLRTDPRAYFDSLSHEQQDRIFTQAGAEAIRLGADINQVVNARRGMHTASGGRRLTRESTTRGGVSQPGRRMPETILAEATGRADALRLLRRFGYVR